MQQQGIERKKQSIDASQAAMIDALYGFISDPDGFEAFIASLDDHFSERELSGQLGHKEPASLSDETIETYASLEEIEHHFDCAARIFDRMGLAEPEIELRDPHPDQSDNPAFILGNRGKILKANRAARILLGARAGLFYDSVLQDPSTIDAIARLLDVREASSVENMTVVMQQDGEEEVEPRLYTIMRQNTPEGEMELHVSSCGLGWRHKAGALIGRSFGLSQAEQEILKGVVEGKSFAVIARERGRSVETVRTQAKSLLRKTGARSQVGLVRLFAAICISHANDIGASDSQELEPGQEMRTDIIDIGAGRILQVDLIGSDFGIPVIMLHGLFSGTAMTDEATAVVKSFGFRIIAPWRPGSAQSSRDATPILEAPEHFAEDIESLMDHYNMDQAILLGRFTGCLYTAAAAQRLGDRAKAIIMLSLTPPLERKEQLRVMRGWQRVFAYAITYSPSVVPVLVRGMRQFLFRQQVDKFMQGFYGSPEVDVLTSKRPDIHAIIEEGVNRTFFQDTKAHERDLMLTGSNWLRFLEGLSCPILAIHGGKDPVSPIEQVENLVQKFDNMELVTLADEGQLYVHAKPLEIWRRIHSFIQKEVGFS